MGENSQAVLTDSGEDWRVIIITPLRRPRRANSEDPPTVMSTCRDGAGGSGSRPALRLHTVRHVMFCGCGRTHTVFIDRWNNSSAHLVVWHITWWQRAATPMS